VVPRGRAALTPRRLDRYRHARQRVLGTIRAGARIHRSGPLYQWISRNSPASPRHSSSARRSPPEQIAELHEPAVHRALQIPKPQAGRLNPFAA